MNLEHLTKEKILFYIDKMIKMSAQLEGDYWTAEHYLSELPEKWNLSYVALENNELIGFMIVSDKGGAHHLHRIVIDQGHQKKGAGKELLFKLIANAKKSKKKDVTLKVHHTNFSAIEIYKHFGFTEVERSGENYLYKRIL